MILTLVILSTHRFVTNESYMKTALRATLMR
jgi:hypothetical protein